MGPWLKGETGTSLIEVIVALGILGFIGMAFLSAIGTSSRSTGTLDQQVVAEELAREQLADIMVDTWGTPYTVSVVPPPGYSLSISTATASPVVGKADDCKLQSITVSITRDGRPVHSVTTYRHNPDSTACP